MAKAGFEAPTAYITKGGTLTDFVANILLSFVLGALCFVSLNGPKGLSTKLKVQSTKNKIAPNADGTTSMLRTRFRVRVPVALPKSMRVIAQWIEHV